MDGRVRVQRAHEDLDLRVDTLLLIRRLADNREGTDTLTVETLSAIISKLIAFATETSYHVLGERLR
jgi:hypothetical protein